MSGGSERSVWGSKLGFLLAAIGSAIGLGNIWRYSYVVYENGGGAFLIPYAVALLCAGIPLMILEYGIGHRERGAAPLAMFRVSKRWEWLGWWMSTVAMYGIMLFYAVVIGWCINYFFFAFNLSWGDSPESFFFEDFLKLSDSPLEFGAFQPKILGATILVWLACWSICFREVNHGVEKACMIFMPLLFVLTLGLVGWTLSLDGAWDAVKVNYLTPDWAKINPLTHPDVWVAAFGQIFFTLSLGFGIMITYSSYLPRKTDIVGNALWTTVINCAYSFVTGFAVFGIIGFLANEQGVAFSEVFKSGPGLAFVAYPAAISELPVGNKIFGVLFFLVLIMAGLSSGISLIEAFAAAVCDKFNASRKKVVTIVCGLGVLGSLIFTTQAGLLVLDIVDHYVNNFGLVLGGLLECIVVAWIFKAHRLRQHINAAERVRLPIVWDWAVMFFTPIVLLLVLGYALINEFKEPYGGYSVTALLALGVSWLVASVIVAVVISLMKWDPKYLDSEHETEDEKVLI